MELIKNYLFKQKIKYSKTSILYMLVINPTTLYFDIHGCI